MGSLWMDTDLVTPNLNLFGASNEWCNDYESMLSSMTANGAEPIDRNIMSTLMPQPLPHPAAPLAPNTAPRQTALKKKGRDEAARSRKKQERKKQALRELEENLEKKTAELKRLEQENMSLRHRHTILDRIIGIRNHQLGIIRQQPATGASVAPTTTINSSNLSAFQPQPGGFQNTLCGIAAGLPAPGRSVPHAFIPPNITLQSRALQLLSNQCDPNSRPESHSASVEYYQNMTSGLFLELYKGHLFKLSEHLQLLESTPYLHPFSSEKEKQQQQHYQAPSAAPFQAIFAAERGLIIEAYHVGILYKFSSIHHPDVVAKQMVRQLETGAEELPSADHWRMLTHSLVLTLEQQLDMLGAGQLYKRLMSNVLAERTRLQSILAEHGHTVEKEALNVMMHLPVECQVLGSLLRNLRREKSLGWMLQGFFFGHVCTVLQFSKAISFAYPHMPDAVAIVMTLFNDMEAENRLPASLLDSPQQP